MEKVTIVAASRHRNGICGAGFYSIIFYCEQGRMHASLFDEPGCCAVHKIDLLADGNIEFANGNSWRGGRYEDALRPALMAFMEAQETSHHASPASP